MPVLFLLFAVTVVAAPLPRGTERNATSAQSTNVRRTRGRGLAAIAEPVCRQQDAEQDAGRGLLILSWGTVCPPPPVGAIRTNRTAVEKSVRFYSA